MEQKITTTTTCDDLTRASGGNSAGPLLTGVTLEFQIGEERRCLARFVFDELASRAFIATPKALRIIGGHDLLWDRPERAVPITGVFETLEAAGDAAEAWATAFNESQA